MVNEYLFVVVKCGECLRVLAANATPKRSSGGGFNGEAIIVYDIT